MNDDKYIYGEKAPFWVKRLRSVISLYVYAFKPKNPPRYHYYLRDNYFSRLYQWKYFVKDYITKPKYKEIHYHGEFGPELMFALPYAYWHHCNGTLKKTVGCKYTKSLYFFSENHEEYYSERNWRGTHDYRLPNIAHCDSYDFSKWKQVPLREHYQNSMFGFDKPVLIIANRYNIEWGEEPISYIDIDSLDKIISKYKEDFTIIYNRPKPNVIVEDNSEIKDLDEFEWMQRKHPEVVMMQDLFEEYKDQVRDFNHFQLLVYANGDRFVSVHGGTAVLASYFGGANVIFSKKGVEHYFKEFQKIYPPLSGATIYQVDNYPDLLKKVDVMMESLKTKAAQV